MVLASCTRRAADSIDRRFCFDITITDRPGAMTLQALSDQDRQEWLEAMDGKEPVYAQPVISKDSQVSFKYRIWLPVFHESIFLS